jgi:NAD/NADP transhydrogenase beta subunit
MQAEIVEAATPLSLALLVGIVVSLLLNNSSSQFKNAYQYFFLVFMSLASGVYLLMSYPQLASFWRLLSVLNFYDRLALAAFGFSTSCALLNAALYLSSAQRSGSNDANSNVNHSVACIDSSVNFEVPDVLPDDDKHMFDLAFEK